MIIPPVTASVDDEYLNRFMRPKRCRQAEASTTMQTNAHKAHWLRKRASIYHLFGLLARVSAMCFWGVALMLTLSRMFA